MVEPSVKTARVFAAEVNGGLVFASRSFVRASQPPHAAVQRFFAEPLSALAAHRSRQKGAACH
jgi:hypothetical protein